MGKDGECSTKELRSLEVQDYQGGRQESVGGLRINTRWQHCVCSTDGLKKTPETCKLRRVLWDMTNCDRKHLSGREERDFKK